MRNYTATTVLVLRAIVKNGSSTPSGTTFLRFVFSGGTLGYVDLIYTSNIIVTLEAHRADGGLIGTALAANPGLGAIIYMADLTLTSAGANLGYQLRFLNYDSST